MLSETFGLVFLHEKWIHRYKKKNSNQCKSIHYSLGSESKRFKRYSYNNVYCRVNYEDSTIVISHELMKIIKFFFIRHNEPMATHNIS